MDEYTGPYCGKNELHHPLYPPSMDSFAVAAVAAISKVNDTVNKILKEPSVATVFKERVQFTPPFKAVKVTEDNIREIAGEILARRGGTVTVEKLPVAPERSVIRISHTLLAGTGDWIVEGYDYENSVATFTKATLAEREKYDLR